MSHRSLEELLDEVLGLIVATGLPKLRHVFCEALLAVWKGRGLKVIQPSEADAMESIAGTEPYVEVSIEDVLSDALGPRGITVGGCVAGGFLNLDCAAFRETAVVFQLERHGSIAALRGATDRPIVIVHTGQSAAAEEQFWRSQRVFFVRLRDVDDVTDATFLASVATANRVVSAVGSAALPITGALETFVQADPLKVTTYATMEKGDALFEAAAAKIMDRLTLVLPLGARMPGIPVPDGLLIGGASQTREAAVYDGKSTQDALYDPTTAVADQQQRYLPILERLEAERPSILGRGVVLFVPDIDASKFADKTAREAWRRLTDAGRKVIVITAAVLLRWEQMLRSIATAPALHVRSEWFWRFLFDGKFADADLTDDVMDKLAPSRGRPLRVLAEADADVALLAALDVNANDADAFRRALRPVDQQRSFTHKVAQLPLVTKFHENLRGGVKSLVDLATSLGVSEDAARYLIVGERFEPQGMAAMGDRGVATLNRLRGSVS